MFSNADGIKGSKPLTYLYEKPSLIHPKDHVQTERTWDLNESKKLIELASNIRRATNKTWKKIAETFNTSPEVCKNQFQILRKSEDPAVLDHFRLFPSSLRGNQHNWTLEETHKLLDLAIEGTSVDEIHAILKKIMPTPMTKSAVYERLRTLKEMIKKGHSTRKKKRSIFDDPAIIAKVEKIQNPQDRRSRSYRITKAQNRLCHPQTSQQLKEDTKIQEKSKDSLMTFNEIFKEESVLPEAQPFGDFGYFDSECPNIEVATSPSEKDSSMSFLFFPESDDSRAAEESQPSESSMPCFGDLAHDSFMPQFYESEIPLEEKDSLLAFSWLLADESPAVELASLDSSYSLLDSDAAQPSYITPSIKPQETTNNKLLDLILSSNFGKC